MSRRWNTACPAGHPYVKGSFTLQLDGGGDLYRQCRQCNRERAKAWRASRRPSRRDGHAPALPKADDERVLARARRLCRLPDGSECQGPGHDCDAENCFAIAQAMAEASPQPAQPAP